VRVEALRAVATPSVERMRSDKVHLRYDRFPAMCRRKSSVDQSVTSER
jgi:hypothetical protein